MRLPRNRAAADARRTHPGTRRATGHLTPDRSPNRCTKGNGPDFPCIKGNTPSPPPGGLGYVSGNTRATGNAAAISGHQATLIRVVGGWATIGVMFDETSPRRPGDPPWRSRTAHRTSSPAAMAALRRGRLVRGWSMTAAARHSGVSRPMISQLESGRRRPSESVAEDLIAAYRLTGADAAAVRGIAIPLVGRDSPYKTGDWPVGARSF